MFVQPLEIGTTKNSFPKCSMGPNEIFLHTGLAGTHWVALAQGQ